MKKLHEYLKYIKNPDYMNVERRETFGREEYVISYAKNFFVMFQTYSTKLFLFITDDKLPNEMVIYDPGMGHLLFDFDDKTHTVRFSGVKRYLSEDFAFQQSLLQEPLFSTEDLQELFQLHEQLDKQFNPHKYYKDSECTFLDSSISFLKTIFSSSK